MNKKTDGEVFGRGWTNKMNYKPSIDGWDGMDGWIKGVGDRAGGG